MPRPYSNPYLAGVALGLVLLACFVLTGQGLGASGAFAHAAGALADSAWFRSYQDGQPAWIVAEVLGVAFGGAVAAIASGRFKLEVARGPATGKALRLAAAGMGGILMGIGAALAGGCTSGQALSGGAMLSVGSWAFMMAVFAAGFAAMPFFRRLWQ